MAEPKHSSAGKNFGKVLQKTVYRTKEKVLQNLGKADKTSDDGFDILVQNFSKQQLTATKLQKELKNYVSCVKDMSVASKAMYDTIRDTYEPEWTGHSDITGAAEALFTLWEDYLVKLIKVQDPMAEYVTKFPDLKQKIAKRKRKLTDYDGSRHALENLHNQKKKDDLKIQKATTDMNTAKAIYEEISDELHQDLPQFYDKRKSILSSVLNSLFSSEAKFQEESAKIKDTLADVTERLNRESSDVFFKPFQNSPNERTRERMSSSESTPQENKIRANIPHDNASLHSSKSNHSSPITHSNRNSGNSAGAFNVSSSPVVAESSLSSDVMEAVNFTEKTNGSVSTETPEPVVRATSQTSAHEEDAYENVEVPHAAASKQIVEDVSPPSPVHDEPEPTNNNEESKSPDEEEAVADSNTYSVALATEDTYSIPLNNQRVDPLPNNVLFQVQATHPYTGDDIDELTFETGDLINVIEFEDPEDQDDGWLMGIKITSGEKGVFPENFTKRL